MFQIAEQVERWTNVERVLNAMPQHERQKHWNMSIWGAVTECGTVACAAGHCGLDSWFRDRGFKLDFNDRGESEISNVADFFGLEGSDRIFLNTQIRPVEAVIEEVRGYTRELQKVAALMAGVAAPAVGEYWPEQHGIYAGAMLGHDGEPDYFLIVGPACTENVTWHAATEWAAGINVDGRNDFALPSRAEQVALFDRVRSLFEPDWYWSSTQHEVYSGYAWNQRFANGNQNNWNKDNYLRARAVRRSVIQ